MSNSSVLPAHSLLPLQIESAIRLRPSYQPSAKSFLQDFYEILLMKQS
jgi:hypothetical protein